MVFASGVNTLFEVNFIVGTFLSIVTNHIAFTLLGHNVTNHTLLTVEIIANLIRFVRSIALRKHRLALHGAQGVLSSIGKNRSTVDVHRDDICSQINLFIGHLALTIQVSKAVLSKHNGI